MKKLIVLFLGILLITSVKPALAAQFKSGDNVTFSGDTLIEETVFVSGNNIQFDSPVNGDIYCAGRNIAITGEVKGDIICAGQKINITGDVDGNVRVVGQSISIDGVVSRNISVLGQDLYLGLKSNVKGDILFGGQNVDLSGIGGRDLIGAGDQVRVSGSLLRNAVVTVSSFDISEEAKIDGSVDYFVSEDNPSFQLSERKNILGEIRRHEFVVPEEQSSYRPQREPKPASPALGIIKTVFGVLSFSVLSFLMLYFIPKRTENIIRIIGEKPVVSGLIGLAVFVTTPVALMIICSTIIGLPSAFIILMMYIISMFVASIYPSLWIGRQIMHKLKVKSKSQYLAAFIGCLAVGVISAIPVLGWFVIFSLFLVGLGSSFLSYLPEKK